MKKNLKFENKLFEIEIKKENHKNYALFNQKTYLFDLEKCKETLKIFVDGEVFFIKIQENGINNYLINVDNIYELEVSEENIFSVKNNFSQNFKVQEKKIKAQMPGKVIKVLVKENDNVKKNQILFILEAMKMENEIVASANGKISNLKIKSGDVVNTGDVICKIIII